MSSFFRHICVAAFLSQAFVGMPSAWAQTDQKVSLMIYVDLSPSMAEKRAQVAAMADYITQKLEIQCGDYEIGVSNILYKDAPSQGGELVANANEPLFITKETPRGKELLRERIQVDNEPNYDRSIPPYASGIQELTYSSVALTLANHLKNAPSQLQNSLTVGALIISDAAPFFDPLTPDQAIGQIRQDLGNIPFIAGALGAQGQSGSCMDAPSHDSRIGGVLSQRIKLLEDFTRLSRGPYWNMCLPVDIEQSVRDFILMLMETAGCMLIS